MSWLEVGWVLQRHLRMNMLFFVATLVHSASSCTTLAVDRMAVAGQKGSLIAGSTDSGPTDFRLVHVPAKDHPAGAQRSVFAPSGGGDQTFPRYSTPGRAPAYEPQSGQPTAVPIGYIPQVLHTYAYVDAAYGVSNEHGLAISETSCSAKLTALPLGVPNGTALFHISELSDFAMERCRTARCAIDLMGDLATSHGFFGTDMGGAVVCAGESLMVGDAEEAWIFHVLADITGKSAVWVAQRIPEGHFAVVADMFVIREVVLNQPDRFRSSKNIFQVAKQLGHKGGALDFTATFSAGEYSHPHFSGRRMWRGANMFAPSLSLDPDVGVIAEKQTFPMSVASEKPLTPQDIFRFYRDHFEGTPYSLVQPNAAGGIYSSPSRLMLEYPSPPSTEESSYRYGAWETPVAMQFTMYAFVVETDHVVGPVVHWAPHAPDCSLFYPVPVRALKRDLPYLVTGSMAVFDPKSAWWVTTALTEYVHGRWSLTIGEVKDMQSELENAASAFLLDLRSDDAQTQVESFHEHMVQSCWALYWRLLAEFQSGYTKFGTDQVGYPKWVLEQAHYGEWATRYPGDPALPARFDKMRSDLAAAQASSVAHINQGPERHQVRLADSPAQVHWSVFVSSQYFLLAIFGMMLFVGMAFAAGVALGRSSGHKQEVLLG